MKPLARIDLFDLDDTAFASAHSVDGVHPVSAVANEP
jgi:hypothetical protein